MITTDHRAPVFAEIGADHPFAPALAGFRARLAEIELPQGHVVSSEIKGRRTTDGWALDRFYSSAQTWNGAGQRPFSASTLYWKAGDERADWFQFPTEPYLCEAAGWLHPAGRGARTYDVLRYVPLRRLTVRTGLAGRAIVKFKRRSRLVNSWARVSVVAAASARSGVRVPPLVGLDQQRSSYIQLAVDGPSMDQLVNAGNVTDLLGQAGRLHAEFHALQAPDLPAQDKCAATDGVAHDADWLAAQRPQYGDSLRRIRERLLATAPAAAAAVTCHGDLIPSHLIGRPESGWTVIDLDLAQQGDPHRDVAVFLAGLPADLGRPDLVDAAQQAYLDGYADRSTAPLDPTALGWHRSAAELHQLTVAASKDRLPAATLRDGMERLLDSVHVGSWR